jgi:TM2 domain-containing membrane protein YozV
LSPSDVQGKKLAAGITAITVGALGIHKFVLGYHTEGALVLSLSLVSLVGGACCVFPFIGTLAFAAIGLAEGVIYLSMSDAEFARTHLTGRRPWF